MCPARLEGGQIALAAMNHPVEAHPGGGSQWRALVQQTAPMWLDYEGLSPDELCRIDAPTLIFSGDRDEMFPLDLMLWLYRALPNAELAVSPRTDHLGPVTTERAGAFASLIRDFARRHGRVF